MTVTPDVSHKPNYLLTRAGLLYEAFAFYERRCDV